MDKEFLEPGDSGYAEAKAKREARWASREAAQQKELHADTNKVKTNEDVEEKAPRTPLFKSKIGKKIASTLTKAGDKAEELRAKKQYLNTQLNRITGRPVKLKPKQRAIQTSTRPYHTPLRVVSPIQKNGSYNGDSLHDLIHGNTYEQPGHKDMMSDLIHGDTRFNTSSHANDLIFGKPKPKKKNGKRNDPFNGLLG